VQASRPHRLQGGLESCTLYTERKVTQKISIKTTIEEQSMGTWSKQFNFGKRNFKLNNIEGIKNQN